jgi:hypothetical protein
VVRASRGIGFFVLSLFTIAFASFSARGAEGRTSSLSWLRMPGADSCIATQALARSVEDRLGRPGKVFVSAAQADVSVEGRIEKKRDGWHAIITIRDGQGATLGNRELDQPGPSCEAMNEQLAFVIAVMIDPEAAMRERPQPTATTTPDASVEPLPPPTATATTTASSAEQPVAPPKKDTWMFEGGGDVTIAAGLAPSVAIGAGVEAILYPPGIPVGFRGFTALFPSIPFLSASASKDGARATFDMLYVGGTVCPTLRRAVNVMLCLGGQFGALRAHAETDNRGIKDGELLPIWNALLEARMSFTIIKPIGASGGLGLAVPLLVPKFEYRTTSGQTDTLHEVSPVVFVASGGLGFVFP